MQFWIEELKCDFLLNSNRLWWHVKPILILYWFQSWQSDELRHDKINKVTVCPAKTQFSLGICPVGSESSLSTRRKLGSLATHSAHREDSDQTGWIPRLIWVFAERTLILFGFVVLWLRLWLLLLWICCCIGHSQIHCFSVFWRLIILLNTICVMKEFGMVAVFVLVFNGPSTHVRSFRVWSVNLSTLFLGKPPGHFASTKCTFSLPETDNFPSWISRRERMAVEIISWPNSTKECC